MLRVMVPVVSEPSRSKSHAVTVTSLLLLVTVLPVHTVSVPSPSLSKSASITNGLSAVVVVISSNTITPAPARRLSLAKGIRSPVVDSRVNHTFAVIRRPSVNPTVLSPSSELEFSTSASKYSDPVSALTSILTAMPLSACTSRA